MRTRFLVIMLAWSAAGCGPSNTTTIPNIPSATVKSLSINGPATLAPGATAIFTATAQLSTGLTEDDTAKVAWRSGNLNVLSIDAQGRATGKTGGETQVTATIPSFTSRANVMVLPPDTYRLAGAILESGVPVPDATVAVTSGIGTGLSTKSDGAGQYRLYGVAGVIDVTVTKNGYTPSVQSIVVNTMSVVDISVVQTNPSSLTGTYQLTITADTGCFPVFAPTGPLPGEFKSRHYTAAVTQTGPNFRADLSGAEFVLDKNGDGSSFTGRADPGQISFSMRDGYYYSPYPDLVESVGVNTILYVTGNGVLTQSGSDFAGPMNGSVVVGPPGVWASGFAKYMCYSKTLQVALTRQAAGLSRIRR